MSVYGLSDHELTLILSVLRRHPEVTGAILFGSRAMGVGGPGSDIDLALLGIDEPLQAERVASDLDELPLPYHFDIKAYHSIHYAPLREHIDRVGIHIG